MPGPWVGIQRNRISGAGVRAAEIRSLCDELRRRGIRPHVYSRREKLAARLGRPDGREGLVCLIAAGGDGTISDLVNTYPGVPLSVLPLGTENLLARHFGIPCDGKSVAAIVADGRTRSMDLGVLNGRRFTLMVTAGFDADVVHRTHGSRRGHIQKW